jgi:hypothetical protein
LWPRKALALIPLSVVLTLLGACATPKIPESKATVEAVTKKLEPAWQAPLPHGGDQAQLNTWWAQWNDPVLAKLQAMAQAESSTLAQASAKIEQARAQLVIAGATQLPSVDSNNSVRRSALGIPPFGAPRTQLSTSFDASWELDLFGGIARVVTTLGLFGFDPESRRMRLEAVHPGVTVDHVRANTPIELLVADRVETTAPPSARELDVLRGLDPARQFIG